MSTITEPTNEVETTSNSDLETPGANAPDAPDSKPKREPKKKTLAGRLGRSSLMLVRRTHLYSGIFMFPFVLLYGFSGWFFNHPRMFTGDEVHTFTAADVSSDLLAQLPTATDTAQSVVDEMNLESFMVGGPEIKLSPERTPRFSGFLSYTVNADEATHQVTINPVTGSGEIRTTHVKPVDETDKVEPKLNPLADIRSVQLPEAALGKVKSDVPKILDDLGLPSGEAFGGRRSASLVFQVEADGVPCLVTYSVAGGGISSIRNDDRPTMETKNFLQRLHLARTYSPEWDTRWVWALLVDAMFVSMVFWGISGLMMWWQVKRTRLLGGGVLFASVVFAAALAINMHDSLTTGARRGGGNRGGGGGRAAVETPQTAPIDTPAVKPANAIEAPTKFASR